MIIHTKSGFLHCSDCYRVIGVCMDNPYEAMEKHIADPNGCIERTIPEARSELEDIHCEIARLDHEIEANRKKIGILEEENIIARICP